MPGWACLLGTLAYNYSRYRRGKPTICAVTRRTLPRPASATALCLGFAYLLGHVWRGYQPKETPMVTTAAGRTDDRTLRIVIRER